MNWSTGISWLTTLRGEHSPPFDPNDPADMGTAFGLDASLAPEDSDFVDPSPIAPSRTERPWESRLVRRSGL